MTAGHLNLSDLERLANRRGTKANQEDASVSNLLDHIQQCPSCSELAQVYAGLAEMKTDREPAGNCPPDEWWLELAAGISDSDRTTILLDHLKRCGACAALLKGALEDLDTATLDAGLPKLKSSTMDWQNAMAQQMNPSPTQHSSRAERISPWRQFLMRPVPVFALCALVVVIGFIVFRRNSTTSEDRLLASAYNQQRRTELHMPGGEPVEAFSPPRGTSETDDSVPLLQLRQLAQEQLAKDPGSAHWEQLLGRIAIAEGNGEAARKHLELASARDATLPGLNFDLASAHFEIGEAQNNPQEFATAADLFGKVIDNPSAVAFKGSAYFNRALCSERIPNYEQALADFKAALAIEKDPEWQAEIRRRLPDLERKVTNTKGGPISALDTSPEGFLTALRTHPEQANAEYELYLDHASREWLAERTAPAQAALRRLAQVGTTHQDVWLRDVIKASTFDDSQQGFSHLAQGLTANMAGDPDHARLAFQKAGDLFRSAHNTAAELRVEVEMLYTLQRLGHSDQCIQISRSLDGAPQRLLAHYSWLYGYEVLESAVCSSARGDSENVINAMRRALAIANKNNLPVEELRAQGMLVDELDAAGQHDDAWREIASGLEKCAAGAVCTPMRAYQFLLSLYYLTADRNLHLAASDAARSAAQISDLVSNLQIRAYAHEVFGVAETAAGHTSQAGIAFTQATKLLDSMPTGNAVALYRADWETDRAELLDRQGSHSVALQRLKTSEDRIAHTDNFDIRQRFYVQLSELLLKSGDSADAENAALTAVADAEHALSKTYVQAGKLTWERTYGRGYRVWAHNLIAMNRPRESLQAWEWYRSAPYRLTRRASPTLLRSLPALLDPNRNVDLLAVVARLDDRLVVWTISPDSSVRAVFINVPPDRVVQSVRTFAELCTDPTSSQRDIDFLGAQIYREIFGPVDDQIEGASRIAIETDASLQGLPFAALIQPDGRYFGDAHSLSMLAAWWSLQPNKKQSFPPFDSVLVIEGTPALPPSATYPANTIPQEYFETNEVAAHFHHAICLRGPQATVTRIVQDLSEADVVHYNGHSFAESGRQGLLLQPKLLFTSSALQASSLGHCRLVVLSTCSSAAASDGGIEDPSNLTHAFLAAGAQNVVATLWDADARASKTMMIAFYDALAKTDPIPEAIRVAQRRLRDNPASRHPFFWSSVQVYTQ